MIKVQSLLSYNTNIISINRFPNQIDNSDCIPSLTQNQFLFYAQI